MGFNLKGAMMISAVLAMTACTGGHGDYKSHKKKRSGEHPIPMMSTLDSADAKSSGVDPNCYYGSNPPPLLTDVAKNNEYKSAQYVAFRFKRNGQIERVVANPQLQGQLDAALNAQPNKDFVAWKTLISEADNGDFVPFLASNPPVTSVGTALQRPPDPLDFHLKWYSVLAFKAINPGSPNDNIQFSTVDPLKIASGGYRSPFYGPASFSQDRSAIFVDYLSLPEWTETSFDTITPRTCVYQYELNMMLDQTVGNTNFTSNIIIDPGGDGEEDDPQQPDPPAWP